MLCSAVPSRHLRVDRHQTHLQTHTQKMREKLTVLYTHLCPFLLLFQYHFFSLSHLFRLLPSHKCTLCQWLQAILHWTISCSLRLSQKTHPYSKIYTKPWKLCSGQDSKQFEMHLYWFVAQLELASAPVCIVYICVCYWGFYSISLADITQTLSQKYKPLPTLSCYWPAPTQKIQRVCC